MPTNAYEHIKRPEPSRRADQSVIQFAESDKSLIVADIETERYGEVSEHDLQISKADHFRAPDAQSAASYKLLPEENTGWDSTDVFLISHSEDREYVSSKREGRKRETRGYGVGNRFISSSKLADFMDMTFGHRKGSDTPIRIWLISCKAAGKDRADNSEIFARWFAKKLMDRGWKSTQIIGFESTINTGDLRHAQSIAENSPLDQRPKFPSALYVCGPRIWTINDQGELVKSSGAYKDGTDSENGGLIGAMDFNFSDMSDEEDEA